VGKKLYVGNLSYNTTSSELQQMFGPHGTVQSAEVIQDRDTNRSKGFGFVLMGSDSEAKAAIAALNGQDSGGRALTVNEARPKTEGGGRAVLFTGDRDMFQCVSESVSVLFPGGKDGPDELGPADVRKRYGIPPEIVPDFIALRGDPSDGIPGGTGIGEKTARDLLLEYGTLEGAIANAVRERPRVQRALREQAEQLRSFKEIATLVDVPVQRPPDRPTDYEAGAEAARSRGMNRLAERLQRLAATV